MKTNQVLKRSELFIQRTKDGYFNANVLLDGYNKISNKKPKQLQKYKNNESFKESKKKLEDEGIEIPVKSSRGITGGTWMHPKLFIDFAMWVSVEFKSTVIDYVLDGLIKTRNDAGDYYNEMCAAILESYIDYYGKKPPSHIYITEANMIKSLAVGEDKIRNNMSENELSQITYLQKVNTNLIKKHTSKSVRIKKLIEAAEIKM